MAKVLIKKLDPAVKLPVYKTNGASGMDLIAFINKPINIKPKNIIINSYRIVSRLFKRL